jgi:hypothetical protein
MSERVSLLKCQRRLLAVWLLGISPALLLMITRSLLGGFSGRDQEVWSWFIPTFLPTLSLMIGAYAKSAFKEPLGPKMADRFFFRVSFGVSAFYLSLLTIIIVAQPFLDSSALDTFARSSLFLTGVQGFIAACLGVFFVSQE